MFSQIISTIAAISVLTTNTIIAMSPDSPHVETVAEKQYSLSDRYGNSFVNNVFADNILLTLAYMRGVAKDGQSVDWNKVKSNFSYDFVLKPGQTFAFHDQVLPEYKNDITVTTNAHFDSAEGFESDGWLVADGVCHLASFMNVVARSANLQVVSPTPHDFAKIPDVPEKYGVAIYYMPGESGSSSLQNLYVKNTFNKPVMFTFIHTGSNLDIKVQKLT